MTLLAGGVAIAAGGGLGFALAADSQAQAIADEARSGFPFDPSLQDARSTYQTLSVASCVAGGALVATGAILMGIGARAQKEKSWSSNVRLTAAGNRGFAGAILSGEF